ncbi:MAG TPA: hypothetical protein VFC16_10225, partial [Nakamurella sp.]|nr:hypothetical protein [Nakamurella sp.]
MTTNAAPISAAASPRAAQTQPDSPDELPVVVAAAEGAALDDAALDDAALDDAALDGAPAGEAVAPAEPDGAVSGTVAPPPGVVTAAPA